MSQPYVPSRLTPFVLGRLFDTIGRKPMIAGTYILSGLLLLGTAFLFGQGSLTATTMTACFGTAAGGPGRICAR
jgi:hypothetical protein